jgi:hypothetical protein
MLRDFIVAITILIALPGISLQVGCKTSQEEAELDWTARLIQTFPEGATDIKELNDGWFEFTWRGNKYLYRFMNGTECMVPIK